MRRAPVLLALSASRGCILALAAGALVAAATSCTSFDVGAFTEVTGPDYGQFKQVSTTSAGKPVYGVSVVLERRCGTLDCHGQAGRPLRLYGQYGRRFIDDAGDQPGLQATTETEHEANYQSVIGLQPELITEVVQGNAQPDALLLLRKPLQLERHKGGAVIIAGDDADNCILSWLAGKTDYTACTSAVGQ